MQKKIDTVKLKSLPGDDAQHGFFLFRLQGYVLFYYVLDARTGLVGVQVMMT